MYVPALNLYVPFARHIGSVANVISADQIDKNTLEIAQADDETYTSIQELADELPDHSPRFILLSYPLTLVSQSTSCPGLGSC